MPDLLCIDASIAVRWVFPEDHWEKAVAFHTALTDAGARLVAPEHFSVERVSVVRHKVQQGLVDDAEADEALRLLFDLDVRLVPVAPLAGRTLQIANALGEDAWDAAYIAVAEAEGCDFWTADKVLARRARRRFPFVKLLGEDTLEEDKAK